MMIRWLPLFCVFGLTGGCTLSLSFDDLSGGSQGGADAGSDGSAAGGASGMGGGTGGGATGGTGGTAGGAGGMDPELSLPHPNGDVCTYPGATVMMCDDPDEVCRIFDANEGRCEGCNEPVCGNLGAPCSTSSACNSFFQCYQRQCTNICLLGTMECGHPDDCIDVGHVSFGVCRPF